MASTKTSLTTTQEKTEIIPEQERPSFVQEFYDLVQRRAYHLFEQDGHADGKDVEHWLQAEDEFMMHPAVHDAAGWFTLKVSLPAESSDHVKIFSDGHQAIISANAKREETTEDGAAAQSASAYYSVRWPECVDPHTAKAQFKNGVLTLTARKAESGESTLSNTAASGNEKANSAANKTSSQS
jgi:HSP20 family molecular chaperone IbpA